MIDCRHRLQAADERWLFRCVRSLAEEGSGGAAGNAQAAIVRHLLRGLEALQEARSSNPSSLAELLRRAARGVMAGDDVVVRCDLLVAQGCLEADRWADALAEADRSWSLSPATLPADVGERLRRVRGIALRNLGRCREAADELQAVMEAQIEREDLAAAARTLPSLLEVRREFGDFAGALDVLAGFERRAGSGISDYDRVLLAMWRGILNKNLMQDAVLFRWDPGSGTFEADRAEADHFRREAEAALAAALDIVALTGRDDAFLAEVVQVQSELAETALSYALVDGGTLDEADRRLRELSRLLALRSAAEPEVEYHRHCAHRAAIDGGFAESLASLRKARRLAAKHGMRFLEADCDLDWGRIVARSPSSFGRRRIEEARDAVVAAAAGLRARIGEDTYYPKVATMLTAALEHALRTRDGEDPHARRRLARSGATPS